jgi:hypothetical protein
MAATTGAGVAVAEAAITVKVSVATVVATVAVTLWEPVLDWGTITVVVKPPSLSVEGTGAGRTSMPPSVRSDRVEKVLKPAPTMVTVVPVGP